MTELLLRTGTTLRSEIEVKRSRFLAVVARVDSPGDAREVINAERTRYPDARHHCSAFAVSVRGAQPILHSSDDGEPAGTAGRPMLEIIMGVPLLDVVAVVTRYFGGTLLGTGGLVRAYSDAVRTCFEGASLVERRMVPQYRALLPHAEAGRYLADFSACGWTATPDYRAEGVSVTIGTADSDATARFASLTSGSIPWESTGACPTEVPWGRIHEGKATQ